MHRSRSTLACLALTLLGAGCAGQGAAPLLGVPSPATQTGSTGDGDGDDDKTSPLSAFLVRNGMVVGSPTDVYTRIARGILTCWFGAAGPLKRGYIYHADAEPASKGGRSEIKIMIRDMTATDPRSLRAYHVVIEPSDTATKVEVENVRIPEVLAARLGTDIERWSRDEAGCGEGPVTGGWAAKEVEEKAAKKGKGNDKARPKLP
jgi:hypothetical protein